MLLQLYNIGIKLSFQISMSAIMEIIDVHLMQHVTILMAVIHVHVIMDLVVMDSLVMVGNKTSSIAR